MSENVKELVNALATGDATAIEASFNAAMAEKVSARIDDMRATMAQNLFKTQDAVVEEEFDLTEEEIAAVQSITEEEYDSLDEEEQITIFEAEKWIQKAISKPGSLHKQLHVPAGEKIPAKKLAAAAEKGGKLGKRARLAQTLKKLNK